jgi:hypothetical protein
MGTSFTEYHGYGFWSRDSFWEKLAGEVVRAIKNQPSSEEWLIELASHWDLQSRVGFNGWVHLKLDEFLTTDTRTQTIRALVQQVSDGHSSTDAIHKTARLVLQLIDGQLKTDASSPLDYMVDETRVQS